MRSLTAFTLVATLVSFGCSERATISGPAAPVPLSTPVVTNGCRGTAALGVGDREQRQIGLQLDRSHDTPVSVVSSSASLELALREVTGTNLQSMASEKCAVDAYINLYNLYFDSSGARLSR